MASKPSIVEDAVTTLQNPSVFNAPELELDDHQTKIDGLHELDSLDEDGIERPTEEETHRLRRVAGKLPLVAYLICLVEFAERASYYGCYNIFSNFIQFPLPLGGNGAGATPAGSQETAGALGKGLSTSSALTLLFQFLAYTLPILGGWIADVHLGRFKVVFIGVFVGGLGHIILTVGAIPSVLQAGNGMAPFIIGLLVLALGAGLFKSNVSPLLLDQDTQKGLIIKTLPSGERVIIDPEVTAQRLTMAFYGMVNVGAFFGVATSYAEKDVGYWLAFLLPLVIYLLLPFLLIIIGPKLVKKPASGSQLGNFFSVIWLSFKRGGIKKLGKPTFFESAKPSVLAESGVTTYKGKTIPWNDGFVEDVKRTLVACQIFLFFPIYNLNDGGIGNIQTSQGSSMTTNGAPNDLLGNFNSLTIIIFIPILAYVIYPALRARKIHFGPIARITFGFFVGSLSNVVGAITQYYVYMTSPCGYYATGCDVGTGVSPISIWVQIPQYSLAALSECFVNTTALEIAYARSPANMKGLATAIYLFSTALSAAIAEACTPGLVDPHLIWYFAAPAIACTSLAVVFWFMYKELDNEEYVQGGMSEAEKLQDVYAHKGHRDAVGEQRSFDREKKDITTNV